MSVLKDSVVYALGEIIAKITPFLLLPYLARQLGGEGYGELSYYYAIMAFALIFIGLSQQGAVTRYYYFYGKNALSLIVNSGYLYSFVVSIIGITIAWIFRAEIIVYCLLTVLFQSFFSVQLSLRQCQKKALQYTLLQIAMSILNVIATLIIFEVFRQADVVGRIYANLLAIVLICVIAVYFSGNLFQWRFTFSWQKYKLGLLYIVCFGLPLIFHSLSYTIKGQLDRFLLYNTYSASELGVYSAGVQLASMLSVVLMAVNLAAVPHLYERLKNKTVTKVHILRWAALSFALVPIPWLASWLIPDMVFVSLFGRGFEGVSYYFRFFLINYMLVVPYFILGNYLFFYAKNKYVSLISVSSVLIYVAVLLIASQYDIQYVPLAAFAGNLVMLPSLYYLVYKHQELAT